MIKWGPLTLAYEDHLITGDNSATIIGFDNHGRVMSVDDYEKLYKRRETQTVVSLDKCPMELVKYLEGIS